MSGTKASYTAWSADVALRYAASPWAILYGWLPSVPCVGVMVIAHGGGWIATSNIWNVRYKFDWPLVDTTLADMLLNNGFAVFWVEYNQGWQANYDARVCNPSRFPQIPRSIGRAIQFIKTHALDGYITGNPSVTLPTSDDAYGISAGSAGSVSSAWLALQPDGFLDYDPAARSQDPSAFGYTGSHRVRVVFANDCATDFRKFGKRTATYDSVSSAALPYFGSFGRFYRDTFNNTSIALTDKFASISDVVKGAASPLVSAAVDFSENLNVSLVVNNGSDLGSASYLHSGVTISFGVSSLTGTTAGAVTVQSTGGSVGTVKLFNTADGLNGYLYVEPTSGLLAGWPGDITIKNGGGSTIGTIAGVTSPSVYGDDNRPTFLSGSSFLTLWDAAPHGVTGLNSVHGVEFGKAMQRVRVALFAAAGVTSIDRYLLGSHYPAQISGDEPSTPFNSTSFTDIVEDHLQLLGMIP